MNAITASVQRLLGQMLHFATSNDRSADIACLATTCMRRAVWPRPLISGVYSSILGIENSTRSSAGRDGLQFDPNLLAPTLASLGSLPHAVLHQILACQAELDASHGKVKSICESQGITLQTIEQYSPGQLGHWVGIDFAEEQMSKIPLVGRATELKRLQGELRNILNRGTCLAIFGQSGVGKSVLLEKVLSDHVRATVSKNNSGEDGRKLLFIRPSRQVLLQGTIVEELEKINDLLNSDPSIVPVFDQLDSIASQPHAKAAFQEFFSPVLSYGRLGAIVVTHSPATLSELSLSTGARFSVPELPRQFTENVLAQELGRTFTIVDDSNELGSLANETIRLSNLVPAHSVQPHGALRLLERVADELDGRKPVSPKRIREVLIDLVASMAGLAAELIADPVVYFERVRTELSEAIVGQDHAIARICNRLLTFERRISHSGQDSIEVRPQPLLFLLAGPPGLGKTETARQLADLLQRPLHIFPMHQYATEMARTSLLGSDPGYKGSGETRTIHNVVMNEPRSLILLDEIEKAHPDVQNALLSILEGEGQDPVLGTVSFGQVVFFMTSNRCDELISQRYQAERAENSREIAAESLNTVALKQLLVSGQANAVETDMLDFVEADKADLAIKFSKMLQIYHESRSSVETGEQLLPEANQVRSQLRQLIAEHLAVIEDERRLSGVMGQKTLSKPLLDRAHEIIPYLPFLWYTGVAKSGRPRDELPLKKLIRRLLPGDASSETEIQVESVLEMVPNLSSVRTIKTIILQQIDSGE